MSSLSGMEENVDSSSRDSSDIAPCQSGIGMRILTAGNTEQGCETEKITAGSRIRNPMLDPQNK